MPKLFPFDTVETVTDYELFRLATPEQYLLPVDAEVLSCVRGTSMCSRNKHRIPQLPEIRSRIEHHVRRQAVVETHKRLIARPFGSATCIRRKTSLGCYTEQQSTSYFLNAEILCCFFTVCRSGPCRDYITGQAARVVIGQTPLLPRTSGASNTLLGSVGGVAYRQQYAVRRRFQPAGDCCPSTIAC